MTIIDFVEIAYLINHLRTDGVQPCKQKVVLCHGCFDLLHIGHVKYFQAAKAMGDILIVTITPDAFIDKGPGRPVFNQDLRAEFINALECVDYVAINKWPTAQNTLEFIRPDIYVKGQEFENLEDSTGKIQKEYEIAKNLGIKVAFTHDEIVYSSTKLIKDNLEVFPKETRQFLNNFTYDINDVKDVLESIKNLKVLVIGDGIIDEYHYCDSMGKSAKATIVVQKYVGHELFAGGAFAIANHISNICDNVQLVSLLGANDSREEFIETKMDYKINTNFFYRTDAPTICKKRYVDKNRNQKLFEVNYLNDKHISDELENKIIDYLKYVLPTFDVVLVSDFGHGFITPAIIETIEKYSKAFSVNTQTNSANAGFNMITKYHNPNFVCLDETEARLATIDRFGNIEDVAKKLSTQLHTDYLIITLGQHGSIGINAIGEITKTPIFSTSVLDTVGAGDAFFAFTAPCFTYGLPLQLVAFIGNCIGALAVQIQGNKRSIKKEELINFVEKLIGEQP